MCVEFSPLTSLVLEPLKLNVLKYIFAIRYLNLLNANLRIYRIASSRMNRDIRDEFFNLFLLLASRPPRNHLKILRGLCVLNFHRLNPSQKEDFGAQLFTFLNLFVEFSTLSESSSPLEGERILST
jgi:hypothetical protein